MAKNNSGRIGVKVVDNITIYGVGVYEVAQKDGTFDGFTVGALYGRKTKTGNEKREFHALARLVEDAGLSKVAAGMFNDFTQVWADYGLAVVAGHNFVDRFGLDAAGLLPKEQAKYAEIAAALRAKKEEKARGVEVLTGDAAKAANDGDKKRPKKSPVEKIAAAVKSLKTDGEKISAIVAALHALAPDAAAAANAVITAAANAAKAAQMAALETAAGAHEDANATAAAIKKEIDGNAK